MHLATAGRARIYGKLVELSENSTLEFGRELTDLSFRDRRDADLIGHALSSEAGAQVGHADCSLALGLCDSCERVVSVENVFERVKQAGIF